MAVREDRLLIDAILNADGNPIYPSELKEGESICDGCGEKEGCICFMEDGIQKSMCFDCLPAERREKLMDEWESGILGGSNDNGIDAIYHAPVSLPNTPVSFGMFDNNDDPIEFVCAALSQMPIM